MWRDNPVAELGKGSPDTYGWQHVTEVQITVNSSMVTGCTRTGWKNPTLLMCLSK